jgi:WD40 repeat protein
MLRLSPTKGEISSSIRLKEVQDKLSECREKLGNAVNEIENRFPRSIFDSIDIGGDELQAEINESEGAPENETLSQFNRSLDDRNSESFDGQTSVVEISPPTSPIPFRRDLLDTESNFESVESSSQAFPQSPYSKQSKTEKGKIRNEMMKLFKISTGGSTGQAQSTGSQDINEILPVVTSVPREAKHCLLLLFRLELPKVLGTVSRIAVNSEGYIAGCTIHGEIFVFSRLPYSRFPDAMTRGHDGGIVSITWLPGPELCSYFITNGTDRKTLIWQVTDRGIDGPHCDIKQPAVPTSCCVHPVNRDIIFVGLIDNTFAMYKVERNYEATEDDGSEGTVRLVPLGIGGSFNKPITAMSVSPDGRKLAVGSSVGTVGFFDLNTMSLDVEVDCRNRQGKTSGGRKVVGLDWSHDSECVLVSSCDSRLRVVLVSDLSRRTKFKSNYFINENLFLAGAFGPPDDSRIVAVSESGHLCIWRLHAGSETNETCIRCNLIDSSIAKKFDKDKSSANATEVTASVLVDAGDPFCEAIQAKTFNLGETFQHGNGMAFVTCDTSGSIRIFAELSRPSN